MGSRKDIIKINFICFFLNLFVFFFYGCNLQHLEVSGLGVESELRLWLQAYTTATAMPDPSLIYNLHSN